jgi:hypothetical protein
MMRFVYLFIFIGFYPFKESDPEGIHCLTALKWLLALLSKTKQAFAVQLDGSLCSVVPKPSLATVSKGKGTEIAERLVSFVFLIYVCMRE